jgi:hypothetical protein
MDRGAHSVVHFQFRFVSLTFVAFFIAGVGEGYQGYLNLKAYKDFAAENWPEGYTAWVSFAISPAGPSETPTKARLIRK